jgi:hypothetical protein
MNAPGLNIRFLAQGMIKLSPDDLPAGWDNLSREDLLKAVAYLEIEEDSVPDCLEVDNENYDILARTPAWAVFNQTGSSVLEPMGQEE